MMMSNDEGKDVSVLVLAQHAAGQVADIAHYGPDRTQCCSRPPTVTARRPDMPMPPSTAAVKGCCDRRDRKPMALAMGRAVVGGIRGAGNGRQHGADDCRQQAESPYPGFARPVVSPRPGSRAVARAGARPALCS